MRKNFKNVSIDLKEQLKQKCLNQIKEAKMNKINQLRHENDYEDIIKSIFNEEEIILSPEEMEKFQKELVEEYESNLLEDYEKNLEMEEKMIEEMIEQNLMFNSVNENCVVCPCCKKNRLLGTSNALFCKCGLNINIKCEGIQLKFVQQNIVDAHYEHGSNCKFEPVFRTEEKFGSKFLTISCEKCGAFRIIV